MQKNASSDLKLVSAKGSEVIKIHLVPDNHDKNVITEFSMNISHFVHKYKTQLHTFKFTHQEKFTRMKGALRYPSSV